MVRVLSIFTIGFYFVDIVFFMLLGCCVLHVWLSCVWVFLDLHVHIGCRINFVGFWNYATATSLVVAASISMLLSTKLAQNLKSTLIELLHISLAKTNVFCLLFIHIPGNVM